MRVLVMSRNGDDVLGEWNAVYTEGAIAELGRKFAHLRAKGYRAFGTSSGARFDAFSPEIDEDVLMIAPVVGG